MYFEWRDLAAQRSFIEVACGERRPERYDGGYCVGVEFMLHIKMYTSSRDFGASIFGLMIFCRSERHFAVVFQ